MSFFDEEWNLIGTKISLLEQLSLKTKIPPSVLDFTSQPSDFSVAQRFSWASLRITKRVEDRAYSLMGLFDINMPMIYGEREKAFLRLQQQIIQKTMDESIFAWEMGPHDKVYRSFSGLYAPSPSAYRRCSQMVPTSGSEGFSETNGRLFISLVSYVHSPGVESAVLHCTNKACADDNRVGILVAATSSQNDEYVRVRGGGDFSLEIMKGEYGLGQKKLYRVPIDPREPPQFQYYGYWLRTLQPPGALGKITILSNCPTPEPDYISQHNPEQGNTGIVYIEPKSCEHRKSSQISWIKFGFTMDFNPLIWLGNHTQTGQLQERFERAAAAQRTEIRSPCIAEIMERKFVERTTAMRNLYYDWPEGRALIEVNRNTGLRDFVILELNLKISVQLQPIFSPALASQGDSGSSGPRLEPVMVWVVDITETKGDYDLYPVEIERLTCSSLNGFVEYLCSAFGVCCCCAPEDDRSCFSLCEPCLGDKLEQRFQKEIRSNYEKRAPSRLPYLTVEYKDSYPTEVLRTSAYKWKGSSFIKELNDQDLKGEETALKEKRIAI